MMTCASQELHSRSDSPLSAPRPLYPITHPYEVILHLITLQTFLSSWHHQLLPFFETLNFFIIYYILFIIFYYFKYIGIIYSTSLEAINAYYPRPRKCLLLEFFFDEVWRFFMVMPDLKWIGKSMYFYRTQMQFTAFMSAKIKTSIRNLIRITVTFLNLDDLSFLINE